MAKILVVDDAAFMRMKVVKHITELGHEAVEAENGKDAVEKYSALKPDMVLMDITMPEMDGIAAVKMIKAGDPHAKIAMLSAMGQQAMVIDAIKAGARDFVLKPFQPEKLTAVINKILNIQG